MNKKIALLSGIVIFFVVVALGSFWSSITFVVADEASSPSSTSTPAPSPTPTPEPPPDPEDDERVLELKERLLDEVNKSGVGNATLQKWVDSEEERTGTAYPEPYSLVDNPYDCEGLTEDPHRSFTNRANANVHARTSCPNDRMPTIHATTQLYQMSCNPWPNCSWNEYGPVDPLTLYNKYRVNVNSAGPCVNANYKGTSLHYIIDGEGDLYYGFTQNSNYVSDCAGP